MLVLAAGMLTGCAGLRRADDPWLGADKWQHFAAAGLAGAAAVLAAEQNDIPDGGSFAIGVGVAVGLGAGKEVYDDRVRGTFFSTKDLVWDVVGGAVGSGIAVGIR